jgi:hypothetical protein
LVGLHKPILGRENRLITQKSGWRFDHVISQVPLFVAGEEAKVVEEVKPKLEQGREIHAKPYLADQDAAKPRPPNGPIVDY